MASSRKSRPADPERSDGGVPPDGISTRFTFKGHTARLLHFPGRPDREPPPGTQIIPGEDGRGEFWVCPESIKIMRGGPSS